MTYVIYVIHLLSTYVNNNFKFVLHIVTNYSKYLLLLQNSYIIIHKNMIKENGRPNRLYSIMDNLVLKWICPGGDFSDAYKLRYDIFVNEQGFEKELDEYDAISYHLVIYYSADGKYLPVACGRIYNDRDSKTFRLGRICVSEKMRGQGLGLELMKALEAKAAELGAERLLLGAQQRAMEFYIKAGYQPCGELYMDEFCEHINMYKYLRSTESYDNKKI